MKIKVFVAVQADLEYEVDDVMIVIQEGNEGEEDFVERRCWVRGFDDVDWTEANAYAEELAKTLGVEFVGEIAEEYVGEDE